MDSRYQELLSQVIAAARDLEASGADPAETGRANKEILGPVFTEIADSQEVADLGLGEAFQNYNDRFERVPRKEGYDSLTPTYRCKRCDNRTPVEFAECYVCGEPAPPGAYRPAPPAALRGHPGRGPPARGLPAPGRRPVLDRREQGRHPVADRRLPPPKG